MSKSRSKEHYLTSYETYETLEKQSNKVQKSGLPLGQKDMKNAQKYMDM